MDLGLKRFLDGYKAKGMSSEQLKQIRVGIEHKLNTTRIRLYAKTEYTSYQMEQIRIGIEHGLSDEQIATFSNPDFTDEEMEHIRVKLEHERKSVEQINADLHQKHLKNLITGLLAATILMGVAVIGFFGMDTVKRYFRILTLDLVAAEVTVNVGDAFVPMNYIKKYTEEDAELILPDPINTDHIGDQKVLYTIKSKYRTKTKELTVHVVDTKAPVLVLKEEEIQLTRGVDSFSCKAYIQEADDEVDGNLIGKVNCSNDIDWTQSEATVLYTVSDASGNTSNAELKIQIKNKPTPLVTSKPSNVPAQTPSPNTEIQNSGSSGQSHEYSESYDSGWIYENVDGGEVETEQSVEE